ncbi:nucleotide exchange factor GrpE [bacterium]|nr:nucleotide exchange factor GrpE [bacterium]
MEHNHEEQSDALHQQDASSTTPADSGNGEVNWKEKYKRLAADFSNHRKRVARERTELANLLEDNFLKDLLVLYDDFSRIDLHHEEDSEGILEGLRAVQRKWQQWLEDQGVTVHHPVGERFDYELHEAVLQKTVSDPSMDSKILRVIANGYLRNDRILRHAKVVVGKFHEDKTIESVPKGDVVE